MLRSDFFNSIALCSCTVFRVNFSKLGPLLSVAKSEYQTEAKKIMKTLKKFEISAVASGQHTREIVHHMLQCVENGI